MASGMEDSTQESGPSDPPARPSSLIIEQSEAPQRNISGKESPWQHRMNKMADRLAHIWKHGSLGDVELLVGPGPTARRFVTHSLVLSMCSQKFATIFENNPLGSRTTITMRNDDPDAMAVFLRFAYLDQLELRTLDQAIATGILAKKYQFRQLLEHCSAFLAGRLEASVACQVYEYAGKVGDRQLEEACTDLFSLRFGSVVIPPSFSSASSKTVLRLLGYRSKEGNENLPDATLFNALYRWARDDCFRNHREFSPATMRNALKDFLYYVNFSSISVEEFVSGPAKSGILTSEELSAIMMNITKPGSAPMPFTSQASSQSGVSLQSLLTCISHDRLRYRLETFLHRKRPTAVAELKVCKFRDVLICGVEFLLLGKADYWRSKKRLLAGGSQVEGEIIVVTHTETFQEVVYIPMDTKPEKVLMLSKPVTAPKDTTIVITLTFLHLSKKLYLCCKCQPPVHDQPPELILDTDALDHKSLHFEKIFYQ